LRPREPLAAGQRERALEPRPRDVGGVRRDAELAEELLRPPLRAAVAGRRGDGEALLRARQPLRQRPAPVVDRRRREQGVGVERRALRNRRERLLESSLRLVEVDPAKPERRERDAEAQRLGGGL